MRRTFLAAVIWGASVLICAGGAAAQSLRIETAKCSDLTLEPDLRIAACTTGHTLAADETARAYLLWHRSDARLRLGDHDGAIADADAAAQILPTHPDVLNAQCWSRAVAYRDLDTARLACDISLSVKETPGTFDSRGLLGLREGRWREAYEDYHAAFTRDPRMTLSLYGRGLAALALGLTAQGEADIARAASAAAEFRSYGLTPDMMKARAAVEPEAAKAAIQTASDENQVVHVN